MEYIDAKYALSGRHSTEVAFALLYPAAPDSNNGSAVSFSHLQCLVSGYYLSKIKIEPI